MSRPSIGEILKSSNRLRAEMVSISQDVELHIRQNYAWSRLPPSVKASLGNAPGLYDRAVIDVSVKNQLRWRNNLVRFVQRDERKYYEQLMQYSREHLMLYPYHLQDMLVQGLRVTPFAYYCGMMFEIMVSEKSYDALPNFTAADCLRLMGVGRNQYIDLMNQYRSKKFFRRRGIKELLPSRPVEISHVEPWWVVHVGYVTEDDIRMCTAEEHRTIDTIIDSGNKVAGSIDRLIVLKLYNRGLIYLNIPIADTDVIVVPPLQGFVMNRVQGDYFETLLYKIFVSIDEHTNIEELSSVLQVDLELVKNAVSVFIRLGFAHKKASEEGLAHLHPSWRDLPSPTPATPHPSPLTVTDVPQGTTSEANIHSPSPDTSERLLPSSASGSFQKRVGFLFDSSLTAYLMMGNLSSGLKSHAVTMFEVGKLADEALDSFLTELDRMTEQAEGEARRYYEHAIALRNTVRFLRHNPRLVRGEEGRGVGVDLLRCESMASLDTATINRLLQKNYSVLVSMAPLSQEVNSVSSCQPPHVGPAVPEMNSIWFKLWLYHQLRVGPPSLLLTKGARLRQLPAFLKGYSRVLVTTWGHDPTSVFASNLLLTVNDALTHSAVLIQGHGWKNDGEIQHIPFPFDRDEEVPLPEDDLLHHPCLKQLEQQLDLAHTSGYVTMLRTGAPPNAHTPRRRVGRKPSPKTQKPTAEERAKQHEISEFLDDLRELGIGEAHPARERTQTPVDSKPLDPSAEVPVLSAVQRMAAEWVPLNLSYGIPLFNERANQAVCDKLQECGLFKVESLQRQTESNRLLTLDLLSFINEHQDTPYISDVLSGSSHLTDPHPHPPPVPMPTRNLVFVNGTLDTYSGR